MMFPKQKDIEIPLLKAIIDKGGYANPKDIYPLITKEFKCLTKEDLESRLPHGDNKWKNMIQWVRQILVNKGEISKKEKGIWRITQLGIQRVEMERYSSDNVVLVDRNYVENIIFEYNKSLKEQLHDKLYSMTPLEFEELSKILLQEHGFDKASIQLTNKGPDGGVDGYGKIKLAGISEVNVAFQCKRWKNNIGRRIVQEFRGNIQGKYEKGIIFTTGNFAKGVDSLSDQIGAVPIVMINGDKIIELMIEKEIMVNKKTISLYKLK